METNQYSKSMSAFCTQRAKMEGESELFWLTEAEVLARLAETNRRLEHLALEHGEQAA